MTDETNALYEILFGLERIRELLRESAPHHRLSDNQKKELRGMVSEVKKNLAVLEKLG